MMRYIFSLFFMGIISCAWGATVCITDGTETYHIKNAKEFPSLEAAVRFQEMLKGSTSGGGCVTLEEPCDHAATINELDDFLIASRARRERSTEGEIFELDRGMEDKVSIRYNGVDVLVNKKKRTIDFLEKVAPLFPDFSPLFSQVHFGFSPCGLIRYIVEDLSFLNELCKRLGESALFTLCYDLYACEPAKYDEISPGDKWELHWLLTHGRTYKRKEIIVDELGQDFGLCCLLLKLSFKWREENTLEEEAFVFTLSRLDKKHFDKIDEVRLPATNGVKTWEAWKRLCTRHNRFPPLVVTHLNWEEQVASLGQYASYLVPPPIIGDTGSVASVEEF